MCEVWKEVTGNRETYLISSFGNIKTKNRNGRHYFIKSHPLKIHTKENGYHATYHSGEMVYCYGNIARQNRPYAYNESDYKLQDIMLNYWANFAKSGNPNGEGLPTWNEYQNNGDKVMELGSNVGPINDEYLLFSLQ